MYGYSLLALEKLYPAAFGQWPGISEESPEQSVADAGWLTGPAGSERRVTTSSGLISAELD